MKTIAKLERLDLENDKKESFIVKYQRIEFSGDTVVFKGGYVGGNREVIAVVNSRKYTIITFTEEEAKQNKLI